MTGLSRGDSYPTWHCSLMKIFGCQSESPEASPGVFLQPPLPSSDQKVNKHPWGVNVYYIPNFNRSCFQYPSNFLTQYSQKVFCKVFGQNCKALRSRSWRNYVQQQILIDLRPLFQVTLACKANNLGKEGHRNEEEPVQQRVCKLLSTGQLTGQDVLSFITQEKRSEPPHDTGCSKPRKGKSVGC